MNWVAAPGGGRAVKAYGEARSGVGCVEQQLAPHFIGDLAGDHQTQTLRLGSEGHDPIGGCGRRVGGADQGETNAPLGGSYRAG